VRSTEPTDAQEPFSRGRPIKGNACLIEVVVPFDTPEEARNAHADDETIDRLFEIFGNNVVISVRIEEATDEGF
jgi:hypothetical protein